MKKIFFVAATFLIALSLSAQTKEKIKFTSLMQAAWLHGESGSWLQLQAINGLSYKTFSAGIGVGIDNYYFKTIPVFVDLRKNFFEKKQTPFVYVDFGTSIPWTKQETDIFWQNDYSNGIYYDLGVGYTFPVIGKMHFNCSFGYSEKQLNEKQTYEYIGMPYDPSPPTYYNYYLKRISFKVGLSF